VSVVASRLRALLPAIVASTFVAFPAPMSAQQVDGALGHILSGAALGAYSGGTLGLVGSLFPCNRTADGRQCVVSAASTGAALGIAMGGTIGSQDRNALRRRVDRAGIGAGAGAAVGLVLRQAVDRYGWWDVATTSLIGGALGAAPEGALIGAGAGAVAGSVAWALVPDAGVQELVLFTLVGVALGGMVDWALGAADKPSTVFSPSLSISFR
jgi:hypothetical protein